jgi:hypothetical protein
MVQRRPKLSTRRIASRICVSRMQVWRTLWHPYHDRKVQRLEPGDPAQPKDLYHWITAYHQILSVILFTDEASFIRDGINNSWNSHTSSHVNPHQRRLTNFQKKFWENVWCGLLGNNSVGLYIFDSNLTGDTLIIPVDWVTRSVGRYALNGKWSDVLPTWWGSPTLHSACDRAVTRNFP